VLSHRHLQTPPLYARCQRSRQARSGTGKHVGNQR
jgi:hypothetical protein